MEDKEPFLTRWSRRKLEAKADQRADAQEAAALPAAAAPPEPAAAPVQAELEASTTPEYREYFDPKVDEALRRVALKKLFSDPHYNVMDGLDTYIDDYSKPDPIPEAMLRQLNQAKDLFLFEEEKKPDAGGAAIAADEAVTATPAVLADASAPSDPEAVDAPSANAATAASAATPPDAAWNK
jgi:hypothetical protein